MAAAAAWRSINSGSMASSGKAGKHQQQQRKA